MLKKLSILFLFILTSHLASAQLKVARIFGDHMVLQRDKPLKIWGWADQGDKVQLTLAQQQTTAKAGPDGKWTAELPAMPAGGPYELIVKTKKNEIKLTDILLGEVWLLSGQSNMEWRIKSADSAKVEIARANFPNIRHFEVAHELAFTPEKDLSSGAWIVTSPATVGDFSAVGYFFARELSQRLGVAVGLVHSSWGASQVEGWISEKAMQKSDVLSYYPATMARTWDEDARMQEQKVVRQSYGNPEFDTKTVDESAYLKPGYDYKSWKIKVNPIGNWDWQNVWSFRGSAYIQRNVDISAEMAKAATTLNFGQHNAQLAFYFNGKKVYESQDTAPEDLKLPAGTWQAGENSLLVKIGPLGDPERRNMGFTGDATDFNVKGAGQKIPLTDIRWNMMPSWSAPRTYVHLMNNVGTTLYNAMIAPLIPLPIAGALWYQGESNAGRSYQYRKSFPLMIENWRRDWGYDFPFLFVQLSSYGPFQSSNEGSDWAELREAQAMTLALPKTGMAVTTDIGNPDNIHPTNKQDVGHRLALTAMKVAYGKKDLVASGPTFEDAQFSGQKAIISFDNVGGGLEVKEKYGYLKGFEIAGRDQKFRYAPARIEGDKVVVSHPDVPEPVAVRYGWASSPIDNNLFNAEGLPAAPFRTDDWPGVTEKGKYQ